jgi:DNA segregation ATPase FtsK/SpoIIIE-like protein
MAPSSASAYRYVVPERPVLIRNGTGSSWAPLRSLLSRQALTSEFGTMPIEVGAAPYYEAAAKRKTTLGQFAAAVADNPGSTREQQPQLSPQQQQQPQLPPQQQQEQEQEQQPQPQQQQSPQQHADYLFVGLYASDSELHAALETALAAQLPPLIRDALELKHLHYRASMQFSIGPAGSGAR